MAEKIFSVGEFLDLINEMIGGETAFIQGEITGAHVHQTGFYFSLKDQKNNALMDCYMSPHAYRGLGVVVEDGMEAKISGVSAIYKPKGRFSFRVETLEPAGEGSLKKAYELLKKKLEGEGLFARKRSLPEFISRIGIITSRTGAVIDDFRTNVAKLGLLLYMKDVRVEGIQAVDQILGALKYFHRSSTPLDVLVVMRGGGSLEDLQPFNNEHVGRAIFASRIPTIVAIGHDRDVPIAQMVADVAPSTPTAAAMLINQSWERLSRQLPQFSQDIVHSFESILASIRPDASLMFHGYSAALDRLKQRIASHDAYLESVNPEKNLKLGYSIITNETGNVVKNSADLHIGQSVTARVAKGTFTSRVEKI